MTTNSYKLEKLFDDFEYALFGIFEPRVDNEDLESEKRDIAAGGYDADKAIPMPPLQYEKPIGGKGLKIMTPRQMITRLPILSAQVKAGNNSNKLKNEIRQIVYSLCRSKNLSKTIYNHLINNI